MLQFALTYLYKYIQVTLGLPLWGFKIPSSSSKSGDLRHINDHRRTPYTPLIFFGALLPISTSCYVECSHLEKGLFSIFSSKLCFVFQGKSLRLRFPACIIMLGIFLLFLFLSFSLASFSILLRNGNDAIVFALF